MNPHLLAFGYRLATSFLCLLLSPAIAKDVYQRKMAILLATL
jgi:hypothetical protein